MNRKQPIRLTKAAPLSVGVLRLTWDDQETRDVDVAEWMQRPAHRAFMYDPNHFNQVSLVHWGGGIEWPCGLDFCAQALRMRADEQLAAKGTA